MNIFEKLLSISSELKTVAKNLEVQISKTNKYKAVGELDVLNAVKPLETKYKVYSYPVARRIVESGVLESTTYEGQVRKQLYERIETTYRFVNVEKPEEYVDIISFGDGIDTGDKSVGKAMTYADKYALMKAYKIMTGDDPDQEPSTELKDAKILDAKLLEECEKLNIKLDRVARAFCIKQEDLTDEDLKKAIEQKKEYLKGSK